MPDPDPPPDSLAALAALIAELQAGDRLRPVTVVVPTGYAGTQIRRELAGGSGGEEPAGGDPGLPHRDGLANVRFTTPSRLAADLAAPVLGHLRRRPASRAILVEAIRTEAASVAGPLAELGSRPGALAVLGRTFAELGRCPGAAIAQMAGRGGRADEVLALFERTAARLTEQGHLLERAVVDAAHEAVTAHPALLDDVGAVVVFSLGTLPPPYDTLEAPLGAHAGLFRLPITTLPADGSLAELPPFDLWSAGDPDEEVRAAIRHVVDRSVTDGVPLWRQAIVHPGRPGYARILHQQLRAAGVPSNGPDHRRLVHSSAGRALLGLLDLAGGDWSRADVMAWLSSAPVLTEGGTLATDHPGWDALSRDAGVLQGVEQWQDRLERHENDPGRTPAERREARELRRLVEALAASTATGHRSWKQHAEWAEGLLRRWLPPPEHAVWQEHPDEGSALEQVLGVIRSLAQLDDVADGTELGAFRHTLRSEIESTGLDAASDGGLGDGVFVAGFEQVRGMSFDTVVMVGMADAEVPGPLDDATLLPDDLRRIDRSGALPTRAERSRHRHESLLAALAAGEHHRVLLHPRSDPRTGREHIPCRWIAPAAGPGAAGAVVRDIPSFTAGLLAFTPSTTGEYDTAALTRWCGEGRDPRRHPAAEADPLLARAMASSTGRASGSFTRFDGKVGAGAVSPFGADHPVSATRFETYATCPRRYFFERVLHVRRAELPEDTWEIDVMERGSMVHRILEEYVRERIAGSPVSLERLLELAEIRFADAEERGVTGRPLLWELEKAALRRDLRRFVAEDVLTPVAVELAFGPMDLRKGAGRAAAGPTSPPVARTQGGEPEEIGTAGGEAAPAALPPVTVTLRDGRSAHFRGAVDRVDVDRDGTLVVSDYKTGRQADLKALTTDPVAGGTRLQLPLYARAAEMHLGSGRPVRARYWLLSANRVAPSFECVVTEEVSDRFEEVVAKIADGVDGGAFPGVPGQRDRDTWKNCRHCDFDTVCPRDRERQWERKRDAPHLAGVVDLIEGGATTDLAGSVVRRPLREEPGP